MSGASNSLVVPTHPASVERFKGGKTETLTTLNPKSSAQQIKKTPIVSRQEHEEENPDGRIRKLKPLEMGVQVSSGIYPQMSAQGALWSVAQAFGRGLHKLAEQKETCIAEGHLLANYVQC